MIGKYCGDTIPPTLISKGNELFIQFQTDISGREKGFQIDYTTSSKFHQFNIIESKCKLQPLNLGCDGSVIGDGICNLDNHYEDCKFDGGDCCLNPELVGNGICNDETNNAACNYDDGECCTTLGNSYMFVHNQCYYVEETLHYVNDALVNCQNIFGNLGILFEPKDAYTNQQVISTAFALDTNSKWLIGVNDMMTYGVWQYYSSGENVSYTNWRLGEPNGLKEHCVEVQSDATWNDIPCTSQKKSICEMKKCPNPVLVGDGYCHDVTNNEVCNFDGGDCCGPCIIEEYCSECECLGTFGIQNALIGNGVCNEETNNAVCKFDGGDC